MAAAEPTICVAIPFHSNPAFLEELLRSLIGQTDREWTAVVADDASPSPGAGALVEAIADPRIRWVRNDTELGVAANFNRCLELGEQSADVTAIVHGDDVLEPGFVAAMRRAHREFPEATLVATRVVVIDAAGRTRGTLADRIKEAMWPRRLPFTLAGDRGLARLLHGLFIYCPAVSYRVDRLPELRFDGRWRQVMDLDLFARVLLGGGRVVLIPDRVYRYRRHAGSLTAANTRAGVRYAEELAVTKEIVAEARRRGWRRSVVAGRLRLTVRLNRWLSRLAVAVRRR